MYVLLAHHVPTPVDYIHKCAKKVPTPIQLNTGYSIDFKLIPLLTSEHMAYTKVQYKVNLFLSV